MRVLSFAAKWQILGSGCDCCLLFLGGLVAWWLHAAAANVVHILLLAFLCSSYRWANMHIFRYVGMCVGRGTSLLGRYANTASSIEWLLQVVVLLYLFYWFAFFSGACSLFVCVQMEAAAFFQVSANRWIYLLSHHNRYSVYSLA